MNQSSTSLEDTLSKAKELFKAKHAKGKDFLFWSYWDVLKEVPKWEELGPLLNKKLKKVQDQSRTRATLMEVTNGQSAPDESPLTSSDGSINNGCRFKRPKGYKAAKDQLQCKKITGGSLLEHDSNLTRFDKEEWHQYQEGTTPYF